MLRDVHRGRGPRYRLTFRYPSLNAQSAVLPDRSQCATRYASALWAHVSMLNRCGRPYAHPRSLYAT